ncbi:hypothetical protein GALL_434470 [mine drainage metagenome]|uniref:Uncharacterized protein n=1 Tax=mine drainage metagenome TaxID=410659 RepID=A0A1J5PVL7_9ZZZZ
MSAWPAIRRLAWWCAPAPAPARPGFSSPAWPAACWPGMRRRTCWRSRSRARPRPRCSSGCWSCCRIGAAWTTPRCATKSRSAACRMPGSTCCGARAICMPMCSRQAPSPPSPPFTAGSRNCCARPRCVSVCRRISNCSKTSSLCCSRPGASFTQGCRAIRSCAPTTGPWWRAWGARPRPSSSSWWCKDAVNSCWPPRPARWRRICTRPNPKPGCTGAIAWRRNCACGRKPGPAAAAVTGAPRSARCRRRSIPTTRTGSPRPCAPCCSPRKARRVRPAAWRPGTSKSKSPGSAWTATPRCAGIGSPRNSWRCTTRTTRRTSSAFTPGRCASAPNCWPATSGSRPNKACWTSAIWNCMRAGCWPTPTSRPGCRCGWTGATPRC